MEVLHSFETSGSLNRAIQRNTPEEQNPEIDKSENFLTDLFHEAESFLRS
jgi:hypothetical protein